METVRVDFSTGNQNGGFNINANSLLPGMDINSAQERNVIIESCMLEIMPNEFQYQLLIQLSATFTGIQTASHPFKLASSINPTRFHLDLCKLAQVAPDFLRCTSVANYPWIRVQIYTDNETGGFSCSGRITTRCRVLPQRSLQTAITVAATEEVPPASIPYPIPPTLTITQSGPEDSKPVTAGVPSQSNTTE